MNQVHKENLSAVENALPNRSSLDFEIFGMEGVPEDVVATHSQRVLQQYYEAEAERRAATGNPPPGTAAARGNLKKVKVESSSDLKRRLSEHISKQGTGQPLGGGDPRVSYTEGFRFGTRVNLATETDCFDPFCAFIRGI